MKRTLILVHDAARQRAVEAVREAPHGVVVTLSEPTRTTEANAAMWVRLAAFSEQLEWPVNGRMTKLTAEDWKHITSAAFRRETARVAMALDGPGVVMLGQRTSRWSQREMSEFISFLDATAADRGVSIPEEQAA
jgi:hypothetical protein